MTDESAVVARRPCRWRSAWPLAVAAGLVLAGRVLLGEVGSPVAQLRALQSVGHPWADPVAPMLSLMALLAEALAGYLLVVLALRVVCGLPGAVGRVARRVTLLVTPVVVRRLLDLLVGSTLLAQATLVATPGVPSGGRPAGPGVALATWSISGVPSGPAPGSVLSPHGSGPARAHQRVMDPVETRPVLRRSAVPLPPWLGDGPSKAAPGPTDQPRPGPTDKGGPEPTGGTGPGSTGEEVSGYTVAVGDTLWDIAAAHLAPDERTVPNVHRYWRQLYRANRPVVGADPDLIHPGTRLEVPVFRRERR